MDINKDQPGGEVSNSVNRFRKLISSQEEWEGDNETHQPINPMHEEELPMETIPVEENSEQVRVRFSSTGQTTSTGRVEEGSTKAHDEIVAGAQNDGGVAHDEIETSVMQAAGTTPPIRRPVIDERGMPLPKSVEQIDLNATRVTPAAYPNPMRSYGLPTGGDKQQLSGSGRIPSQSARKKKQSSPVTETQPTHPNKKSTAKQITGCLLRAMIMGLFSMVCLVLLAASVAVYQYYIIAASLPSVADLKEKASQFETTRILDRNGNVLYEILDPNAGRRTYIPLERISPYVLAATIATEDKDYYTHPGFDPVAIVRALWVNYTTGGAGGGASTITQQLARALLLTPEERYERTVQRKAREIVLAAEITRRYSKEEILELYLNENYYGNMAYGIQAAAETYFNTTAEKLTLAQASFLAGLPQAPAVYDIFTNRLVTLERHKAVLILMYQDSEEKGCIDVSNSIQPICVDPALAASAAMEIENYQFIQKPVSIRYPHWVTYIRFLLEQQFDSQTIYRSGFSVYTTIDPGMQDMAEEIIKKQVASLAEKNVTNGALVAIQPATGEILALVGSADFYNESISGQVNMAISPRQPGSSIKPFTYLAAFEKGWTPATLIWDVETEFPPSGDPNDTRPPYKPVNYDEKFHGPVTVRSALANSYNIPAVKALDFVRIYDDPTTSQEDGFLSLARRMGITTLTRPDYGLSLTLGGGEVSLLEMTSAYSILANNGNWIKPVAITRILDYQGNVLFQYQPPVGEQVVRPEHAFLISSILSDNVARVPMFGSNSVLNLPFPAAAKTGTTNDFRDNWTMGYTPEIAVGVWVGNADYTPMKNTTGLTGAAPIWAQFVQYAEQMLTGGNYRGFIKPNGVVERIICSVSGAEPSQWCPEQRTEFFAADQLPLPREKDLWMKIQIDTWTGLIASPACADYTEESFVINVTDPWGIKWIRETEEGKQWAKNLGFKKPFLTVPSRECRNDDPRPQIVYAGLSDGQVIYTSPLDLYLQVNATANFNSYRVEWGIGQEPAEWEILLNESFMPLNQPEKTISWDLTNIPPGIITLRVTMHSTRDTSAVKLLRLNLQVPTPTETPTPTLTETPTPTLTVTPELPTETPTAPPPTAIPLPTDTPSP